MPAADLGDLDPRTPVLAGVGQASERLGQPGYQRRSPVDLAADAARAALADTGADPAVIAAAIDTVAGVRQFEISHPAARSPLGRSDNYPRSVAGRVGAAPARAILEVTINRPEVRNALHPPANDELDHVFDAYFADDDLWVAILAGAGDQAFSAGNDLAYSASGRPMCALSEVRVGLVAGAGGLVRRRGQGWPSPRSATQIISRPLSPGASGLRTAMRSSR
jgi:hypothetical protein